MSGPAATSWARLAGAWALLLPGVVAFQPVIGEASGFVAPLAGVTLGLLIGLVGHAFAWRAGYRVLALIGGYLLVGGPIALPDTTIAGVVPTLETLRRLSLLVFQGWHDFLTVATPVGDLSGPAAMPLLAGLIGSFALATVVLTTRAVQTPLLLPLAWLALAIAFGVRTAPFAPWLGAALGVGVLAWQVGHRHARTRMASAAVLLRKERGLSRRATALLAATAVCLLAGGAGVAVNVAFGDRVNRQVLRDDVVPPLNLHDYASPLMKHRLYALTQKQDVLFEVRGMPAGARLRLAVLNAYDGNVYHVAQQASQYLRSGRELPGRPDGDVVRAQITVVDYDGVWLPTFGTSARIEFGGERARSEAGGLHFNRTSDQALTTSRLDEGSTYTLDAVPIRPLDDTARERIASAGAGRGSLGTAERVPDVLVRMATDLTAEATSSYQQLATLTEHLRAEGYYSDGADGLARSGHTAERLDTMFSARQWIGDDEQYATAMALMASRLGIPVRVVMGFYPLEGDAPGDAWQVTGEQAHVWVEANLDGAGWVSFDPTPDRDKVPQTDAPQPKPKPKPQIDPPPDPPEKLPDDVIILDEDAANVDEDDRFDLAWLWMLLRILGTALGGAAVVSAPFLAILALKRRRAAGRATRGQHADQLAGAWDEVVDRARDIGHPAASSATRAESAVQLRTHFPAVAFEPLATRIDASVFGPTPPHEQQRDQAWADVEQVKKEMLGTLTWYRRPLALVSLRSLRRRRPEAALGPRRTVSLPLPRRRYAPSGAERSHPRNVIDPEVRSQP